MKNRRSFYLRPRIDMRRTGRKNDENNTERLLAELPPLLGTMPPRAPQGILYTACNAPYLDQYVLDLIRSARLHSPDQHFHFHLFDPTPEAMDSLQEGIDRGGLSVSYESIEDAQIPIQVSGPVYYQVCRFVRLWQFVGAAQSPMFLVDADAMVRNDLTAAIEAQATRDIALFLRLKHRNIRRRVLAAAAMFFPTPLGLKFLRDCAAFMIPYLQKPAKEPIDQMLLYFAWRWYSKNVKGFNYGELTKPYSDWDYDDASFVWHAKGSRKKDPMPLEKIFGASPEQGCRDD